MMDYERIEVKLDKFLLSNDKNTLFKEWTNEHGGGYVQIHLSSSHGLLVIQMEFDCIGQFTPIGSSCVFTSSIPLLKRKIKELALKEIKHIFNQYVSLMEHDSNFLSGFGFKKTGFMRYKLDDLMIITNYDDFDIPPMIFGFVKTSSGGWAQIYGKKKSLKEGFKGILKSLSIEYLMKMNQKARDHAIG